MVCRFNEVITQDPVGNSTGENAGLKITKMLALGSEGREYEGLSSPRLGTNFLHSLIPQSHFSHSLRRSFTPQDLQCDGAQ